MVVYVLVVPVDHRQRRGSAPLRVKRVIELGEPVAVDGAYFIVMLRDLSDSNFVAAVTWLVLVDELVAHIEPQPRLGPHALHVPVRVYQAERRPARRTRFLRGYSQHREDEKRLEHAVAGAKRQTGFQMHNLHDVLPKHWRPRDPRRRKDARLRGPVVGRDVELAENQEGSGG